MRILLDSSVLISLFNPKDPFHQDTTTFIQNLLTNEELEIVEPTLVFLEIINILYKRVDRFKEQAIIDAFTNFEVIDLDYNFAQEILPLLQTVNLKTSDAIICATAKLTNSILITWDKKLQQEANKIIQTADPKNILKI